MNKQIKASILVLVPLSIFYVSTITLAWLETNNYIGISAFIVLTFIGANLLSAFAFVYLLKGLFK